MNFGKLTLALLVITLSLTGYAFSDNQQDENDMAVPAFSDLPLVGQPTASGPLPQSISQPRKVDLNPVSLIGEPKWFDLNRDSSLNEFDVKQFEAIVEDLSGSGLSGLEISTRFREKQKNQADSFSSIYDLDRDGMFTSYDVDYFVRLVDLLDKGSADGEELIQKFTDEIFPPFQRKTEND